MKKIIGLNMSFEEFEYLIDKVTSSTVGIGFEYGKWFYTYDVIHSKYDNDKDVVRDIERYLGVKITKIIIDINSDEITDVIIIIEE